MTSSILLLGADPDAARLIASALRARGHTVKASPFAQSALSDVGDAQLAVVDRVEGAIDASGVCRRIRSTPELAHLLVLAIAQSGDVEERVQLLEAGADDVMAKPFDALELEARVEGLLARSERSRQLAPEPAVPVATFDRRRVIAFFSPKGGAGTTTLAVNVALAAVALKQGDVALLDLDLQWGGVAAHLNLRPRQSVTDLARDEFALNDVNVLRSYATEHGSGLAVFAAAGRPDDAETVRAEEIGRLLEAVRGTYDVSVIDAGSALDERSLTVLEHADRIVIPVVAEIPALRALHALLEVVAQLDGIAERSLLVLNQITPSVMLARDDMEKTLGAPLAMDIPHDPVLYLRAANEGVPVMRAAGGSAPALAFDRLAALALDLPAPPVEPTSAKRRGFGSLLRRGRPTGSPTG